MPDTSRYDVAIVLGALVHADGSPSSAMLRRVGHAVALHHAGMAPRLLLSGGGTPSEAEAMAALAVAAGVAPSRLILETQSRNTVENVAFSLRLLDGAHRLVVITFSWHLRRALHVFRRLGAEASGSAPPPHSGLRHWRCLAREMAVFPLTLWRLDRLARPHPKG
jgi:uncharacterized SAM-binding protein YcdF (DUF218 family)